MTEQERDNLLLSLKEDVSALKEDVSASSARMDDFERNAYLILREGFAKVLDALERFAATKADKADVDQLRADVDELQRAAGE